MRYFPITDNALNVSPHFNPITTVGWHNLLTGILFRWHTLFAQSHVWLAATLAGSLFWLVATFSLHWHLAVSCFWLAATFGLQPFFVWQQLLACTGIWLVIAYGWQPIWLVYTFSGRQFWQPIQDTSHFDLAFDWSGIHSGDQFWLILADNFFSSSRKPLLPGI